MAERGTRRFSQAISEGDGISVIVDVADADGARSAEAQGAEGIVVRRALGGVREATELPILWVADGPPNEAAEAGADACVVRAEDEHAAELYRHKGQLLLRQGHSHAVEELYRKALNIAREQEAKLWELRAAASLARLRRDQGRHAEARDLLAPVYGWFTEGFDTPNLKEAKALRDELTCARRRAPGAPWSAA